MAREAAYASGQRTRELRRDDSFTHGDKRRDQGLLRGKRKRRRSGGNSRELDRHRITRWRNAQRFSEPPQRFAMRWKPHTRLGSFIATLSRHFATQKNLPH